MIILQILAATLYLYVLLIPAILVFYFVSGIVMMIRMRNGEPWDLSSVLKRLVIWLFMPFFLIFFGTTIYFLS